MEDSRWGQEGSFGYKTELKMQTGARVQLSPTWAPDMLGFSSVHSAMFWWVATVPRSERGSAAQPPLFHFTLGGGELAVTMVRLLAITRRRTNARDQHTRAYPCCAWIESNNWCLYVSLSYFISSVSLAGPSSLVPHPLCSSCSITVCLCLFLI